MEIYELTPNNGLKSFNGKAKVVIDEGKKTLYSYNIPICYFDESKNLHRVYGEKLSNTTAKHVKAFSGMTKKEFESLEVEGK